MWPVFKKLSFFNSFFPLLLGMRCFGNQIDGRDFRSSTEDPTRFSNGVELSDDGTVIVETEYGQKLVPMKCR